MKIVHLCLGSFFPDGYSYQENMLPKFHKLQGLDVEVIASLATFDKNGKPSFLEHGSKYRNEYDIPVTRLDYRKPLKLYRKMKRYIGTYEALEKAAPQILFIHGCQFMDMDYVVRYLKKHPEIRVFVDNHADFSNSATNWFSKNILHKIFWRHSAHIVEPFTTKFYGVLPARVDFLKDLYKLPPEKCELLVMGADDEAVEKALRPEVKTQIREKYGIAQDDFLIMTGGKIDGFKTQTLLLMEAVRRIENPNVKLIVFGSVATELKEKVITLCEKNKVQYIGWIQAKDAYDYFASADLVVFPGRHSVFWEQVTGLGIPMLVKEWAGTKHCDVGGNVRFLTQDSVDEIYENITELTKKPELHQKMRRVAQGNGMKVFSYREIAKRSIEA